MSRHDFNNLFLGWPQTIHFRPKNSVWAIGAKIQPAKRPNDHLPENRKYPELRQDMGDLWSNRVRSVWAKKWGFQRCNVKKSRIWGRKCRLAQYPFFRKWSKFSHFRINYSTSKVFPHPAVPVTALALSPRRLGETGFYLWGGKGTHLRKRRWGRYFLLSGCLFWQVCLQKE